MVVLTRVSPVTVGLCIVVCLMAASARRKEKYKKESEGSSEEEQDDNGEVKVCSSDCIQQLEQSVTNQRGQLQTITTDIGAAQLANQEQDAKLQAANDRIDNQDATLQAANDRIENQDAKQQVVNDFIYKLILAYHGHYPVDWLETTCASHKDCPNGINATCFEKKCRCTPGYFYSNGQNACVDRECVVSDCVQSDQLAEFLIYPGSLINRFTLEAIVANITKEECLARCADEPLCPTVEYSEKYGCFLNTATALQVPADSFLTADTDYDLYQKRCV
ncbi:uncharacterized protein [Littorina saxatilis]|uniref:uncharacterized protein n=1 Tax=Littorina saxatilis TaxID=31220 RepID=UPI0038B4B083